VPAILALAFYWILAPTASGDKDGSEFTLVLSLAGVAHPTGYPIYTVLGHLFVVLAHKFSVPWPQAANAWSGLGGAVAVFFFHALSVRLISSPMRNGMRFVISLVPTLLFALNPIWSYETTLAEVYGWHVAWTLGILFFFTSLVRRLVPSGTTERGVLLTRDAVLWGLLCGLGAAHHVTAALTAVPLTISLLWISARLHQISLRTVVVFLAAAALPVGSYAFVAWRAFHPVEWQWPALGPAWSAIYRHVTGASYGHWFGTFAPSAIQQELLRDYVYPFLFPALVLTAIVALIVHDRGDRVVFRSYAASAVLGTLFSFSYGVPDPSSYFLAPMAIAFCGTVSFGVELIRRNDRLRKVFPIAALVTVPFLAILAQHWIVTSQERKGVFVEFDEIAHSMWASITSDRGIVLWANDMSTRLVEYQLLRGEKPNIEVVNPLLLLQEYPRSRFTANHGFDPLAGIAIAPSPSQPGAELHDYVAQVSQRLNEQSPLPVIVFNVEERSVRLLRKHTLQENRP
jgi:hypothetical protein